MAESIGGKGWNAAITDGIAVVTLTDDWIVHETDASCATPNALLGQHDLTQVRFDSAPLGRWDSSLLVFLASLRRASAGRGIAFDDAGLPVAARRLLALVPMEPPAPAASVAPERLAARVGAWGLRTWTQCLAATTLLGAMVLLMGAAVRGRSRMRRADLLACLADAGNGALPVVAVINVLVGGILAFVGAVELQRFGADIYIANLVGVAVVREMASLMTAVVMCGRTGGAYAAEIATMKGTDEIDALRAFGIPVNDYLILPRVAALTCMMPLLYLYGSAIGILGGIAVAALTLDVSAESFVNQLRGAVTGGEVLFGFMKSCVFGVFIALASCRIGLAAGRSAGDVGRAATSAVVTGIVGVIALDALFAVCANAVDF